ncbi:MAG: cupredoxin domain-containing protein [Nitrospirales bacterium]
MEFGKWISRQGWICRTARPRLWWIIGCLSCFVLQGSCEWSGSSTIMVTAEEFRFNPTRIEWVSDQPLRLLIRNQGRERHVFHSRELFGSEAGVQWHQPKVVLQEANAVVLEPGQSIELSFTASAGLFPFRCWIKGHTGMEGTILVKDRSSKL